MNVRTLLSIIGLGAGLFGFGYAALAQHRHDSGGHEARPDARQLVRFPDELRVHTMANMRDHLLALSQIQDALASGSFDAAGKIAEHRLGMTSLTTHGAHEVAKSTPSAV